MPKPDKRECRMGLLYVGNGRFTAYCTCGWVETIEKESPYDCATDWFQHHELANAF